MSKRRIIIEIDPEALSPADQTHLDAALAMIAELARSNTVVMTNKRVHADRGQRFSDRLQPQTQMILDFLKEHYTPETIFTVKQIKDQLNLTELSVRSQLRALLMKNLIMNHPNYAKGGRSQGITGWSLVA